jgi:hypothetical protein
MLTQYKNINQVNTTTNAVAAQRLTDQQISLLSYPRSQRKYLPVHDIKENTDDIRLELHVYSADSWLSGNHKIQQLSKIPEYIDPITNRKIDLYNPIAIDIRKEFDNLKLTAGTLKIVVNFFKNLIGSYEQQYLRIDEISPDRTEIRLRAIDIRNSQFLNELTDYAENVNQTATVDIQQETVSSIRNRQPIINEIEIPKKFKTYLLNFSRNQTFQFVNSVVVGEYVYVKLNQPLPNEFQKDFKCWIVEELKLPYVDNVTLQTESAARTFNKLANPNWQAVSVLNTSTDTGLKTWNELLGSSTQTSQQIIDSYFSGSLSGMKLNIDYSDFNNFIFYSSATERLENFRYKLQLLETYTSQSAVVSQISGSVAIVNQQEYATLKNNLIGGFDNFERWLYYESSSKLTTYDLPREYSTVASITGSYITPAPKSNSSIPYTLYSVTSSQFQNWYNSIYVSASLYDQSNYNALYYAVPEYLRLDEANENLNTFINMLGHHYDIFYTYINHMSKIHKREENPKLGMPNELLYSVAKQFGWTLTNGSQNQDLWQYVLGTDSTGTPLTGSNTVGDPSVPGQDMTYAIWRRIVNNLPLLLKSKGTKRSIQALLSCYGIPQSFISINEYGGPRLDRAPVYEKLNFDYALDLSGSAAGTVVVNYTKPIQSVELRFRTADVLKYPTIPSTMNLYNIGSNSVTIDFSSGTMGVIQINGTGSAEFELFNGDWINTILRVNGTNLDLIAKKSKYGKIVTTVSASATASFATTGNLTIGGTSTGASRLVGQVQELRLWTSSLQNSPFENHTKAPGAYDGNVDAYTELVFRLPLNQKINHSATSSLYGIQPTSSSISASFTSWTNNTPYDSIEETYYYDAVSLGAGTYDDNKIRLESNELIGTLDVKTRAERSQFDKAPLDSKKLGVYFSPQTMIDEDIIAQFGFTSLDEYIGDPGVTNAKSYPQLIHAAQSYWKKYENRNDINAYINMFTLFDLSFFKQLEQLLPARVNKLTGLLIQPNLLERSKDTILPKVQNFLPSYTAILDSISPTAVGLYPYYAGSVTGRIISFSAIDDDQWQGYLTASNSEKYDSVPYSYEYLLRSGSTWITGSSPYWLSDAVQPIYLESVYSVTKFKSGSAVFNTGSGGSGITSTYGAGTYGTSTYYIDPTGSGWSGELARVQDYLPKGIENQRYLGCKLTSPGFNVNSTQTIDGKPVVEFRSANPNQLIYQNLDNTNGSFVLV